MTPWLVMAGAFLVGVAAANAVTVRRYSPKHVVGEVALRGRGLFFCHTPDGIWWQLRLRARRCSAPDTADWNDTPPDTGVREPRRPLGPGPKAGSVALEPPAR